MTFQSCSNAPWASQSIAVSGLYFVQAPGAPYLDVYVRYPGQQGWVPLYIGLPGIPSLQQVRDRDRNITLPSGSYEDAHLYLRSAEGNNMTTAYFTNGNGGGIQSGNTEGYAPLHLQPSGGLLTYGGQEVATRNWVQGEGYLTEEEDPTVPAFVKAISQTQITNWNTAFSWGNHAAAGYEKQSNKVTTLSGATNTTYPSSLAVQQAIAAQGLQQVNAINNHTDRAINIEGSTAASATGLSLLHNSGITELRSNGAIFISRGPALTQLKSGTNTLTLTDTQASFTHPVSGVAASTSTQFVTLGQLNTTVANYIPTADKGANNGVATLGTDGKIPQSQLPALAIVNTFVVASQAAMLALSQAEQGDIAVRTDINKSFILLNNVPGQLASWQELLTPTAPQTNLSLGAATATTRAINNSNGTGLTLPAVTTTAAGLMTTADKTKLNGVQAGATANQTDAYLLSRANHTGEQPISTVTGLQTALDAKEDLANKATTLTGASNSTYPTTLAVTNALSAVPVSNLQQVLTSGKVATGMNGVVIQNANANTEAVLTIKSTPVTGELSFANLSAAAGTFNPHIKGVSNTSNYGMIFSGIGAGTIGGANGRFAFRGYSSDGTSGLTSGNLFSIQNAAISVFDIDYQGNVTSSAWTGGGNQMMVADNNGAVALQAMPVLAETDPVYTASTPNQMMFKGVIPSTGSDLDTYTETGIYHQNQNAGAETGLNYPSLFAGALEVKNSGTTSFVYQTYTVYGLYNHTYKRARYGGIWYPWKRLVDEGFVFDNYVPYNGATTSVNLGNYNVNLTGGNVLKNLNSTRVYDKVYQGFTGSGTTGIISLAFPQATTSATMFNVLVRVYGYGNNYLGEYNIGFYKQTATVIQTAGRASILNLTDDFPSEVVKVGIDASGNVRINLGEATTVWGSYVSFEVSKVETKFTGYNNDWANGWIHEILTIEPIDYASLVSINTHGNRVASREWTNANFVASTINSGTPSISVNGVDANNLTTTSTGGVGSSTNLPGGYTSGFLSNIAGGTSSFTLYGNHVDNDAFFFKKNLTGTNGPWYQVASREYLSSQLSNYMTINTDQLTLSGDKTTTGTWDFRFKNNTWYADAEGIDRLYFGSSLQTTNGFIFRFSNAQQQFQIRDVGSIVKAYIDQDGTIQSDALAGGGATMVIANNAGVMSTLPLPVLTETDPTVPAHVKSITITEKANWNTAFGWGDYREFGLGWNGVTGRDIPGNSLDDITIPNGLYAVTPTTIGNPVASSGTVIIERSGANSYVTQKVQLINAADIDRMFIRHYMPNTSTWSTWRELYHTGNLPNSGLFIGNGATNGSPLTQESGFDFNAIPDRSFTTWTPTASLNAPAGITLGGTLTHSFLNVNSGYSTDQFISANADDQFIFRRRTNSATYSPWFRVASREWVTSQGYTSNTGTVTSVTLTVPTGLTVTGSPVTSAGTLAIGFTAGYSLPTTTAQANWTTAFGWGNHATAGYEQQSNKSTTLSAPNNTTFPTTMAVANAIATSLDDYVPLTQKGAANGVASLNADGKIPNGQLPAIAITETFVVASQAAMLALSAAETGDIAVRTDLNKSFILQQAPPGTLSNWVELLSPTVANTDQLPEGTVNLYFTTARARTSLSAGTGITYNATTGVITNAAPNASHTGDVTGATALTIAAGAVTYAKFQQVPTQTLLGRGATGAGAVGAVTLGANLSLSTGNVLSATDTTYSGSTSVVLSGTAFQRAALTGDVTAAVNSNATTIAANAVTTAKVANLAITDAKIADVAWSKVTGAPAFVTENLATSDLAIPASVTRNLTIGSGSNLNITASEVGVSVAQFLINVDGVLLGAANNSTLSAIQLGIGRVGIINGSSSSNFAANLHTDNVTADRDFQFPNTSGTLALTSDIPAPYTLPVATATTLGGVELFSNTVQSVAASAVSATASRTYGLQLNSAGQAVVNVPWTDNNTTYTGSTSIALSGTSFQRAALTGDVTAAANSNATTIAANAVTTAKIANGAVTDAKIADVAWSKITGAPAIPTATDYVTANSSQTNLTGNKTWEGSHTFNQGSISLDGGTTPNFSFRKWLTGASYGDLTETTPASDFTARSKTFAFAASGNFPSGYAGYNHVETIIPWTGATGNWQFIYPYANDVEQKIRYRNGSGTAWTAMRTFASEEWVQSFGLGITAAAGVVLPDLDIITTPSGLYAFNTASIGNPTGTQNSGSVIIQRSGSNNYITQIAQAINSGDEVKVYFRHYRVSASTWTPWVQMYHSGNFATGTTAQYIRGDGSLAPFPTIPATPSLQQVLTAGKIATSMNGVEIAGVNASEAPILTLKTTPANTGLIIKNFAASAGVFIPQIKGVSNNGNSGLVISGQGSNNAGTGSGRINFRSYGTDGVNGLTSGKSFVFSNGATETLNIDYQGNVTSTAWAGGGNQMMVANNSGTVSLQAMPVLVEADPIYTATIPNQMMYKGQIGDAEDLNNYLTIGIYHQSYTVQAGSGSNYPTASAGVLEVMNSGNANFIYQQYTTLGPSNLTYTRARYAGNWSAWKQLATIANLPTVNNSTITVTAGTGMSGGGSFTLNQAGAGTITLTNSAPNATHTGDVNGSTVLTIAANAITTAKIANAQVSFAKMQNIDTNTLMGRHTAGTGAPESIALGSGLSISGGTLNATAANQWQDVDYHYGSAATSFGFDGLHTNGGYASRYLTLTADMSLPTNVEFVNKLDGVKHVLTLPDPAFFPGRVISISNNGTGSGTLDFTVFLPHLNTTTPLNVLAPVSAGTGRPHWIEIQSVYNAADTNHYWLVTKHGFFSTI